MKKPKSHVILNFILFQTLWFCAVFGGAQGWSLWVWPVILIMLISQGLLMKQWRRDFFMLGVGALFCLALEPIWLHNELLQYNQWSSTLFAPHWIWALWMSFAVSFHYSFSWLQGRYLLGAAFGGIGGVLSVTMGIRIGAASAPEGWLAFAVIYGLVWACAVPLLAFIARRSNADDSSSSGSAERESRFA